ncbi:MAG: LysM peptidoglycan-binding domain-containing protein [Planctomycetota bacterium]|jgi:hypothetical protein
MAYGAKRRPEDGIHHVREGETVSSIAAQYGFTDWEEKIWNAPENSELKAQRVNPNTLTPGDQIVIPEPELKEESRPTDEWHDFHVIRNKRFLRLKLRNEENEPFANKTYELEPTSSFRGNFVQQGTTTDAEGRIEEHIPHTMTKAKLTLPEVGLSVDIRIGALQPLPSSEPVEATPLEAVSDTLGAIADDPASLVGSVAGGLGGALSGSAGGSASLSAGSGGISGGVSGVADAATSAVSGLGQSALSTAASMAGPVGAAVAGLLGDGAFGSETNPNIYPAAQRLVSMGFDAGKPENNKRNAQFTAALMQFQTWCKEQGALGDSAGGPLGSLTAPGGAMGGGGGMLGDLATSVAGPMLAAVGLTGQLDEETVEAIKTVHGC